MESEEIKNKFKNEDYKLTAHFLKQCNERKLDISEIKSILKACQIIDLIKQSDKRYKIMLIYKSNKDLNIVIEINEAIDLITAFPSDIKRRKRKNE